MGDIRSEATLVDARNLLVASPDQRLGFDFFGTLSGEPPADVSGKTLYLTGDVARFRGRIEGAARVFAVEELAYNYGSLETVGIGRLPIRVGGVGAYYRRFFDENDIFRRVRSEHTFQTLTESVKPSKARAFPSFAARRHTPHRRRCFSPSTSGSRKRSAKAPCCRSRSTTLSWSTTRAHTGR
ncbi:MAG: hypothetical protein ACOY0T_27640 [Myxococcota bacterium]